MIPLALLEESLLHAPPALPWEVFSRDWLGERGISPVDWLRETGALAKLAERLAGNVAWCQKCGLIDDEVPQRKHCGDGTNRNNEHRWECYPLEAAIRDCQLYGIPPVTCDVVLFGQIPSPRGFAFTSYSAPYSPALAEAVLEAALKTPFAELWNVPAIAEAIRASQPGGGAIRLRLGDGEWQERVWG